MTYQQIGKVWVTLSLLLTYYALDSWIVSQGGNEIFASKLIVSGRVGVATTAIPICTVLLLMSALVGWDYSRKSPKRGWAGGVPIVGFEDIDTDKPESRTYQGAMLVLLQIMPAAALIHFWSIFLGAKIVTTTDPPQPIASIWDWSRFGWDDPARSARSTRRSRWSLAGRTPRSCRASSRRCSPSSRSSP